MVAKTNKRIMITIPKDWDRLILKAKAYALGECMSTGFLFCYLILKHLYEEGYLSPEEYNRLFNKYFLEDKTNEK